MNTYDPAHHIAYVLIGSTPRDAASPAPAVAVTVEPAVEEHRLPRGYADASPRTRLRTRTSDRSPAAYLAS